MNRDEVKKIREQGWSDVWYITRILVGLVGHLLMVVCVLLLVQQMVDLMRLHHTDEVSAGVRRVLDVVVAVPVFTAGMAGVNWARMIYIRYVVRLDRREHIFIKKLFRK
jgi:hypothetical protein